MADLEVTCDSHGMAYISLTDRREPHEVHASIPLYAGALGSEISALDSIVLDFDRHGRLIGLEIVGAAPKILPPSLVRKARRGR